MSKEGAQPSRSYERLRGGFEWRRYLFFSAVRGVVLRASGLSAGRNLLAGRGITLKGGWRVQLGDNCQLDAYVEIKCPTKQEAQAIHCVRIGHSVFVGRGTIIDANLAITIGDRVLIGPGCFLTDTNHGFGANGAPISSQPCTYAPVVIAEGVWLGAHVVVLPGVTIGKDSVIGANSTVTKNIPENVVAVGSPARVLRAR